MHVETQSVTTGRGESRNRAILHFQNGMRQGKSGKAGTGVELGCINAFPPRLYTAGTAVMAEVC